MTVDPVTAVRRAVAHVRRGVAVCVVLVASAGICAQSAPAAEPLVTTRLIVIKVDGLPQDTVDRFVHTPNPRTGRSFLPWIERLFYQQGVRFQNFYCSGMSLSEPSWAIIDTGRHSLIKGNFEVDRHTGDTADHLNFFNFYYEAARHRRVYPDAVDSLDAARIPLLSDAFRFEERETGIQLLRRGTKFYDFLEVGLKPFSGPVSERVGDLLVGVDFHQAYADTTREAFIKGVEDPELRYVDYYNADVDGTIHDDNSDEAILEALQNLDRVIGQCYAALVRSHSEDRSVIAVVSDHGSTYADEGVYSQGINLISYLTRREFGAHNILTRQGPLSYYSLEGTPLKLRMPAPQTSSSRESYFLADRKSQITCAMDFDGNERAQIHFREPDLNRLQMLLQALRGVGLDEPQRVAAGNAALAIIDRHREEWTSERAAIREELDALQRTLTADEAEVARIEPVLLRERWAVKNGTYRPGAALAPYGGQSMINTSDRLNDLEQRYRELRARVWQYNKTLEEYGNYLETLGFRLSITSTADLAKYSADQLFGERDLGDRLTAADLLAYPAGLDKIVVAQDGSLDERATFVHINYFESLSGIRVRNSIRKELGTAPVDFVAADIPVADARRAAAVAGIADLAAATDLASVRIVYTSADEQVLLIERDTADRGRLVTLVPVRQFRLDPMSGSVTFDAGTWKPGLPFRLYEDPMLDTGGKDRVAWLSEGHTHLEWLNAAHRTAEGLGPEALCEALSTDYIAAFERAEARDTTADARLVRRFELRRREAVATDVFLHANPHWNFDLKDFNPGGNHGGFGRASMHGTFWLHGGQQTRIRPGPLVIDAPFEGLDVVPTLLEAAGLTTNGEIPITLLSGGFRALPGRVASQAFTPVSTGSGGH